MFINFIFFLCICTEKHYYSLTRSIMKSYMSGKINSCARWYSEPASAERVATARRKTNVVQKSETLKALFVPLKLLNLLLHFSRRELKCSSFNFNDSPSSIQLQTSPIGETSVQLRASARASPTAIESREKEIKLELKSSNEIKSRKF